ncbi:MAG: cyclase family protein [Acidobacteriota bacterium]|nr:cyclase family protein [Acidobacteriota bacterium]
MKRLKCLTPILVVVCGCGGGEFPQGRYVDLTHAFDEDAIYWPTSPGFEFETLSEGVTERGFYYAAHKFSTAEHGGTHIDAPIHFYEGRNTVDQIVPEQLIGPGIVVDVTKACRDNRDYLVSVADFESWEARNGPVPHGAIVLLRTGFARFWPDREKYMGTAARGPGAVSDLHFPGLHPDAARWLTTERSIRAIGLDTPSIDHGPSVDFESHVALFERNVPAFENVANLDELPASEFTVIALPMKIRGGSGGPLRIVAIVP